MRFKFRVSQNRKQAEKNCAEQFLRITLAWNYLFLSRSNKRYTTIKGKTWSRGTNSREPFGVNVNLNLSNISNKDTECISQKLQLCVRVCIAQPPPAHNKRKFSIFSIIMDELLPSITCRRHLLKRAFWEIYKWHRTKPDIRVYSSWIF